MEAAKTHQTRPGHDVGYCGIHESVYVKSSQDPTCLRCQKNIEKEEIDVMFETRGKLALMQAVHEMSSDFVPPATMQELNDFAIAIAKNNPQFQLVQVAELVRSGLVLIASGLVRLG
jgi:hypothetical protein